MTDEKPGIRDLGRWLLAYPKLDGKTERVIWWSVLKHSWLNVLLAAVVISFVWQAIFKALVLVLTYFGFERAAWFFD